MPTLRIIMVVLLVIWIILSGGTAPAIVVSGAIVGLASVWVFRDVLRGEAWLGRPERIDGPSRRGRRDGGSLRRAAFLPGLIAVFLWKVLLAGVNTAVLALKPTVNLWPGIVRVRGGMTTVTGTTLFASCLTLTPGTLTIDYDESSDALYVHWIDVTEFGLVDFDARVTSGLRPWMERLEL